MNSYQSPQQEQLKASTQTDLYERAKESSLAPTPINLAPALYQPTTPANVQQLREEAEKRVKAREKFRKEMIEYAEVMAICLVIWLGISFFVGELTFFWPGFVAVGLALGVGGEYYNLKQVDGMTPARREAAIQAEMRRLSER